GLVAPARMCACNRPVFQLPPGHAHQHLRRRAQNLCLAHAQEIKIGRRIHLPQGAVEIERLNSRDEVEPLRKHHLKNISRRNVFLTTLHAAQKRRTRSTGMDLQRIAPQLSCASLVRFAPHRRTQSGSQLAFQPSAISYCPVMSPPGTLPRNIRRGHDMNLVAQMIKGQQPVKEHQLAIRQREIILGVFANFFQLPDHIVRKITDRPRGERWQTGNQCRLMLAQQLLHYLEYVASAMLALAPPFNFDDRAAHPGTYNVRSARRARSTPAETRAVLAWQLPGMLRPA